VKVTNFNPPGNNTDLAGSATLQQKWSDKLSGYFTSGEDRLNNLLAAGSTRQFYNPLTRGSTAPDVAGSAGLITWNGFPRKFLSSTPGTAPNFEDAEPATLGVARPQDEYLEWFVRKSGDKITSVEFTCEGWDYYDFLAVEASAVLVQIYRTFIDPTVQLTELMSGNRYNRFNKWNTERGALHLTERANNLFAEVILAAEATVRRKNSSGAEVVAAGPLTTCSGFGDHLRNSDPAIGAAVNKLARQGRMVTLADPVGLYIDRLDLDSFSLPGNVPLTDWFRVLRGTATHTLRAVFAPPAGSSQTVSDVMIDEEPILFGGQIAQHITMKIVGVASVSTTVNNPLVACIGPILLSAAAVGAEPELPTRGGQ